MRLRQVVMDVELILSVKVVEVVLVFQIFQIVQLDRHFQASESTECVQQLISLLRPPLVPPSQFLS